MLGENTISVFPSIHSVLVLLSAVITGAVFTSTDVDVTLKQPVVVVMVTK